jgi:hypothetical protein
LGTRREYHGRAFDAQAKLVGLLGQNHSEQTVEGIHAVWISELGS